MPVTGSRTASRRPGCGILARAVVSAMNDDIYIGQRHTYGGFAAPFFLPLSDLARHAYVIGKSGTGKSTLLRLFIERLVQLGQGVGLIDPHGDLAAEALRAVPRSRLDDVVYLNLADEEFAPSLNFVSDAVPLEARPRLASALVAAFRHLWTSSWGPRLEHILYHSLRVLIDCQNTSLVALPRLLTDDAFRAWAVSQCRDPFVREFWQREYEGWDKRFRAEAIAPVLNKLGQLAAFPPLRQSLGQVRMKVDVPSILAQGKILIVNLAKGSMGEDAARLLGALLAASLSAAAMERASTAEAERRDFTLVMDEAHCFVSEGMATALSESRKFGLRLIIAHQFLGQLVPPLREAVLGNVGSIFAFRVSGEDAEVLSANYGHAMPASAFAELPPFNSLLRPADGVTQPVRISIARLPEQSMGHAHAIIARSRQRYCAPRAEVEDKLKRWLNSRTE